MKQTNKNILIVTLACFSVSLFAVLSIQFDLTVTFSEFTVAIFHYNPQDQLHVLVMSRVVRVLVACLIGASLGLSGLIMQLQYQNDLADPSLLGVTDGSALAISLMMVFYPDAPMLQRIIISLIGSFVVYIGLFLLNHFLLAEGDSLSLPLLGIVLSLLLSSLTTFIVTYFNIAQSVNAWYSSRLYRVTLTDVWYFLPVLVIGILLLIVLRKQLNILAFGKELTTVIGMNRNLLNGLLSFVVILLTGISVAIVGRLSFIGLVVPHMSRLLIGKRYSDNILVTPIIGALLVLGSDYLSRWLNYPFETPTSVVIALIGVPLFLFLIKKGAGVSYD